MNKENTCCICGAPGSNNIKRGYICDSCLGQFPLSIQHSIRSFSASNLLSVRKILRQAYKRPWVSFGGAALTRTAVQLNGFEYDLSNIASASYEFHPKGMDGDGTLATGLISLVIELVHPHMILEEVFTNNGNVSVGYHINGMDISYTYAPDLVTLIGYVNTAIINRTYSLEEAEREWKQKKQGSESRNSVDQCNNDAASAIAKAKIMFGIKGSFTMSQLKYLRNELAKECHPDAGGSNDEFEEIMQAYKILARFASDR